MLGIMLPKEVKEATLEELHLEFLGSNNISYVKTTSEVEPQIGGIGEQFHQRMNLGTLALPNLFYYVLIGVIRSMCIVEENEEEILFKKKRH